MLSKHYKSTEVDRRTWLHVPSGTPWSTSSDTKMRKTVIVCSHATDRLELPPSLDYNSRGISHVNTVTISTSFTCSFKIKTALF